MRLLKRINDLLDLARLDARGVAVSLRAVDVGLLVHDLVSDLRAVVDVSGLKIETEIPESPLLYSLDAAHFERVLLNLIGNAVKFTPTGGEIRVRLVEAEEWLRVSVSDSGPGIPLAEQDTIFDRFRQLERDGNRRSEGSGIGLALVDELVRLLGGLIEVESEEGRGSTFTVKIPRSLKVRVSDDAAGEEGLIGNASMHRQAELESIGMKTPVSRRIRAGAWGPEVLIVEDDDRLRRQLVGLLAESNRVTGVSGGKEGLREALLFRPHVVVSDVMMPGMDGVELCRRLRERAELRETAVVLLTAKGRLEDRIEGRRVGADSYLTKPFDVRELLATIEGLLRSRMRLVGDYIVQKRLGRGGQSEVWMAEHRLSGEPVALKIIRPSGLEDEKARERLRREHAALTRLDHPNIVKIVDRGEQAGGMFLAMEYLDGVTIDALIRGQTVFPVEVIASIGARAAAALAHVHDHELIHRDVKCSNLMLLAEGPNLGQRVRLIDFGTTAPARRVEGSGAGRIVGSLPYIAPELLERVADPSPGTDIYGLGVVLFRLATGLFPFRGRTVGRVLRASRRDPDPDLRIAVPSMPLEMISAIRRCLAFEPEKRWQKARSLERALLPFADDSRSLSLDAEETPTGATVTISDSMSVWTATTGP